MCWPYFYSAHQMKMTNDDAISKEVQIIDVNYPSLRDICPIWSNRLAKLRKQLLPYLPVPFSPTWFSWWSKITSNSECIVGEAHGFAPFYNCDECQRLAGNFSLYFHFHSSMKFDQTIQEFLQHWGEKIHMSDRPKSICHEFN